MGARCRRRSGRIAPGLDPSDAQSGECPRPAPLLSRCGSAIYTERVISTGHLMAKNRPSYQPRCYFFDISSLLDFVARSDQFSGIQRVAVTLIVEFAKLVPPDTVFLSWYDKRSRQYCCTRFDSVGADAFASPAKLLTAFRPELAQRAELPMLRRYVNRPTKYFLKRTWFDFAAAFKLDRQFQKHGTTAQLWREARMAPKLPVRRELETTPVTTAAQDGDILLLLDRTWIPDQNALFSGLRNKGLDIATLVHDLIPIRAPETCDGNVPDAFRTWLRESAAYTSRYLTVSRSTQRDLQGFLTEHGFTHPVDPVPLAQSRLPMAQDMSAPAMPPAKQPGSNAENFPDGPFALCVGTLEARKNVYRITQAWKHLLDTGHTEIPKLIFAGRKGWLIDDFEALLEKTNNLNGFVEVIEGPSDTELDLLYRKCSFAIMASVYEGWGLPVGEALAYGKTALVADNSSLPEVGQDLVEYCDASRIDSIAASVLRLNNPNHRSELAARIARSQLRTWADVAHDLFEVLQGVSSTN